MKMSLRNAALTIGAVGLMAAASGTAHAALVASATSGNYTNNTPVGTGWTTNTPNTTGFQDWVVSGTGAGSFVSDASWQSGYSYINVSGTYLDIYPGGDQGDRVGAVLPFTANGGIGSGALNVGQTFAASITAAKNNYSEGTTGGVNLQTGTGTNVFTFTVAQTGPTSTSDFAASYTDATGTHALTFDINANHYLRVSLSLTSPTTYSFTVNSLSTAASQTITGTLASAPSQAEFFKIRGSGTASYGYDLMVNSLSIVPEPSSVAVLGLGSLLMMKHRRRARPTGA